MRLNRKEYSRYSHLDRFYTLGCLYPIQVLSQINCIVLERGYDGRYLSFSNHQYLIIGFNFKWVANA
jgi:hypothetical protein